MAKWYKPLSGIKKDLGLKAASREGPWNQKGAVPGKARKCRRIWQKRRRIWQKRRRIWLLPQEFR